MFDLPHCTAVLVTGLLSLWSFPDCHGNRFGVLVGGVPVSEDWSEPHLGAKAAMGSRGTVTGSGTDAKEAGPPRQSFDRPGPGVEAEQRQPPVRVPAWLPRAALPPTSTAPRPLVWATWVAAALAAAYFAWTVPSPVGILFAIAVPLLVLRLPVTGIVLVAVLAQEIKPNGRFGELTTLGYQAYFGTGKIPVVLPLAATAALAAAAQWWPGERPRLRSASGTLLGLAVALVLVSSGVGLLHGQSVVSAVNQNARPFVMLVLGLVVGVSLRRLRREWRPLTVAVGVALVALVVAAAVAIPLGEAADDRLSSYFVYYDSALPAIAAAVLIGVLGDKEWRWDWRHLSVVAAAPLLVLISFRRSVWLAALAALVVVVVLTWRRWRPVTLQLAFAAVVVAVVVLAAPGFAADLGLRSVGSFAIGSAEPSASAKPSAGGAPSASAKPTATGASTASGKPSANAKPSASTKPTASSGPGGPASAAADPSRSVPTQESAMHQAESTSGHLSDLRLGWEQVQANPWTGVGPLAPQIPGMAAQNAERVYVHNELLQEWLRYGPLAPLLVVLFLSAVALLALRAIRDPAGDRTVRSAAAFCLITPLCVMTAPFLSETSRWPLVVGIAAGIVAHFLDLNQVDRRTRSSGSPASRNETGPLSPADARP
ncbi:O-antigen ligase family protein [Micromonospora sp. MS34]|uniref:O-antigen ligase family protein n=1 Tax=Micromonospora sp. MS34 TaxID=3385971 RepID=UPI0039A0C9AD